MCATKQVKADGLPNIGALKRYSLESQMSSTPQNVSITSLISQVPLFEALKLGELAEIASHTRIITAPRRETLFCKDDECTGLYVVVHGQVKLFFSSSLGNEKILDVFGENQILGESALFQGTNYQFYAQTLNECVLLHIARPAIMDALDANPLFARRVISNLSQTVIGLIQDVEAYSLHSGRERVINYLIREALRDNPAFSNKEARNALRQATLKITLPTSKGVIASCLNLTQEHFSRILHDLAVAGFLYVDGRDIHIIDLQQFWQHASQVGLQTENVQATNWNVWAEFTQANRSATT